MNMSETVDSCQRRPHYGHFHPHPPPADPIDPVVVFLHSGLILTNFIEDYITAVNLQIIPIIIVITKCYLVAPFKSFKVTLQNISMSNLYCHVKIHPLIILQSSYTRYVYYYTWLLDIHMVPPMDTGLQLVFILCSNGKMHQWDRNKRSNTSS